MQIEQRSLSLDASVEVLDLQSLHTAFQGMNAMQIEQQGLPFKIRVEVPDPAHIPVPFGAAVGSPLEDSVPGSQRTAELAGMACASDGAAETKSTSGSKLRPTTTLMLCNIPCCVTQEQLAAIINSGGFYNMYDYLYLPKPVHGGNSQNLSYGFINLLTPEYADEFNLRFQGYHFVGTLSRKFMQVKAAHVQGFTNNVRNFRRAHHKDRSCKIFPLTLNGQHIF